MSPDAWVTVAAEIALKGAIILSAALAAVMLMRRTSAAGRHFVLATAML